MKRELKYQSTHISLEVIDLQKQGSHQPLLAIIATPEYCEVKGTVLIPSTFGKRQEAFSSLTGSLLLNGWRVVTFDLRNNEGGSFGSIADFCLLSVVDDIKIATKYVVKKYGNYNLLATSLSARAAIRAFTDIPIPSWTGLLMPVVNAGLTIDLASDAKPYTKWITGIDRELTTGDEVDGFFVRRGFIARSLDADLLSPEGTFQDLIGSSAQFCAFFSTDDAWVDANEAEKLFRNANEFRRRRELSEHSTFIISGVSHQLGRNPIVFRQVFDAMFVSMAAGDPDLICQHAPFRMVAELVRVQREMLHEFDSSARHLGSPVSVEPLLIGS